jgi:hypothetical protein
MSAQMRNQAVSFSFRATEIDQQQPAVRLEDTRHFPDAERTRAIWKAVEHRRAQHDVECGLGERQRLHASHLELDFGAGPRCLFAGVGAAMAMLILFAFMMLVFCGFLGARHVDRSR